MKKGTEWWLKCLVVITFIAMVTVNALANILPINGVTTGAVSDSYPNLFTPAGFTFSIWGLIYVLLAAHALYQLGLFRDKKKKAADLLLRKTAIVFAVTSLVNTAWIFSWHYKLIPLSMILMVVLLVCLIYIMFALDTQKLSLREKVFIHLPFSVYSGWITVATIANATVLLVSLGWNDFGLAESTWTIMVLVLGALIGGAATIRFKDFAYGLVLVWAYTGIMIRHITDSGFSGQYPGVIITVSICIALFIALIFYTLLNMRKHRPQSP